MSEETEAAGEMWVVLPATDETKRRSHISFGGREFQVDLLDPFGGGQPVRIQGAEQPNLRPTVLLDSNTIDAFRGYFLPANRLGPVRRETVRQILAYLVERRFDYNPFFYFIESAAKNSKGKFRKHAIDAAAAVLTLHAMDEALFLETGYVQVSPAALEPYLEATGAKSLEEAAVRRTEFMLQNPITADLRPMERAGYAMLLKAALIRRAGSGEVEDRERELRDFAIGALGVNMARERIAGLHHFAGLVDGLVPVEPTKGYTDVLRRIRSAAWDLLLLRLPEYLLACAADEEAVPVARICAADRHLRQIGATQRIMSVRPTPGPGCGPAAEVEFDLSALERRLGAERLRAMRLEDRAWQRQRTAERWGKLSSPLGTPDLDQLITGLEEGIRPFCALD
jgi:hypothetical protein